MSAIPLSICVYCGSRPGRDPAYLEAAATMGRAIAGEGWRLVYGAGDMGLMGAVAQGAQAAGGTTLGVIPEHLIPREGRKAALTQTIVTQTMHERKKVMFMNADAVVVLPGGAGSLDELFEVLTWRQLGLHAKPVILLNTKGYWDPLLALLAHVADQGFAGPDLAGFLTATAEVDAATGILRRALNA